VFIQVFILWSLNFIAVEIENPFGTDPNDLDGEYMQEEMNRNLIMLLQPSSIRIPQLTTRATWSKHHDEEWLEGPSLQSSFLEVWKELEDEEGTPAEPVALSARKGANYIKSDGKALPVGIKRRPSVEMSSVPNERPSTSRASTRSIASMPGPSAAPMFGSESSGERRRATITGLGQQARFERSSSPPVLMPRNDVSLTVTDADEPKASIAQAPRVAGSGIPPDLMGKWETCPPSPRLTPRQTSSGSDDHGFIANSSANSSFIEERGGGDVAGELRPIESPPIDEAPIAMPGGRQRRLSSCAINLEDRPLMRGIDSYGYGGRRVPERQSSGGEMSSRISDEDGQEPPPNQVTPSTEARFQAV